MAQARLVQAIAKCAYGNDGRGPIGTPGASEARVQETTVGEWHERVLMTVYMKLSGTKSYCVRIGAHWMDVGFQGHDPLTDLRCDWL